jgi:peptide/nickel transport system substrate-binding protein
VREGGFRAVVLGCLLAAAAGCHHAAEDVGNTLIYGRGGEADRLDPIHVSSGESAKVLTNVFDTLVTFADDSVELAPGLAERWESSADGRTWTFYLRPGVKFHDGTALDAQAVVFSFERLIRPGHPQVYYTEIPYALDFQEIREVRAVGPLEVRFDLRGPSAVFLANLTMFAASIVSPAAVQREGKAFADRPVGTGPFRLQSWVRNQELVLAAFDEHWRGRPRVDRVIFVPVIEAAVRVLQLQRGEIHLADDLPPAELRTLAEQPGITVQSQQGMNVGYLTLQTARPPLDHRRLRQAIAHAIDKRGLLEVAYSGQGRTAVSLVPPSLWAWHDGLQDYPFDLPRARALIAEAQREAGFELPLELELFVMASPRPYMQRPQETAVFIKQALREIGIDVRIVVNEISLHIQRLSRGEHQLGLIGWTTDNCDPDNFLYALLDPDNINDIGGNNTSRYRNPVVHDLLGAAKRELNRDRRAEMYRQVQQVVLEDVPVVPLAHTDVRVAQRSTVRGYRLHPSANVWLRGAYFDHEGP